MRIPGPSFRKDEILESVDHMNIFQNRIFLTSIILMGILVSVIIGFYVLAGGTCPLLPGSQPHANQTTANTTPEAPVTITTRPSDPAALKAMETVHLFANAPREEIVNVGNKNDRFKVAGYDYSIDTDTGRVSYYRLDTTIRNNLSLHHKDKVVDFDQGYQIAESFAREKYPEFWTESETRGVRSVVSQSEPDGELRYCWFEIYFSPDKNTPGHLEIYGPNDFEITVSAYTGQVISYSEHYTPSVVTGIAPVKLTPAITRDQAERIAEGHTSKLKARTGTTVLVVTPANDGIPHLKWLVGLTDKEHESPSYTDKLVAIDAHTGAILPEG